MFGQSRAEADIALELAAGHSAAEIGVGRNVSMNTINAQLKSIMARLDCHRQAEITALVASLPRLRSK